MLLKQMIENMIPQPKSEATPNLHALAMVWGLTSHTTFLCSESRIKKKKSFSVLGLEVESLIVPFCACMHRRSLLADLALCLWYRSKMSVHLFTHQCRSAIWSRMAS